ncbi:MAG: DUF302 domain-containing protein [Myxococcales bacterium]|nr:DUF302 domain-containing protein [Myxococcales bacterium]
MTPSKTTLALTRRLSGANYADTIPRVKEALAAQGFGVLTEIDVKATMKKKLDVDFRPYVILGACMPKAAYQALQVDPEIGLLMPCNVIVSELDGGEVEVMAVNATTLFTLVEHPQVESLSREVTASLQRALDSL